MIQKQRFKNEVLTERKCINSILRFYYLATSSEQIEGLQWYEKANEYCKELAGRFAITIQQAAGIIAAFSPQAGWTENKRYAISFLLNPTIRLRSLVQDKKARKILKLKNEADIYNTLSINNKAYKTKSFYLNILNFDIQTDVTIDRHAVSICTQNIDNVYATAKFDPTKSQYYFFQSCYIKAAAQLDIFPHQLQAITWMVYRRIRELKEHEDSNHWKPFTTTDENPF